MNRPTEKKVIASTGGSVAGLTITAFILWIMDQFWFEGIGDIPEPVVGMTALVITSGLTFASGWFVRERKVVESETYEDI